MLSTSAVLTPLNTSEGSETPPGVASPSPLALVPYGRLGATSALELLRDFDAFFVTHDGMAAQHVLRAALFRSTIDDDDGGLTFFMDLVVDLGVG